RTQESPEVQESPSLQVAPGVGANVHAPVAPLQESRVQGLPSSQDLGVLAQAPVAVLHESRVQALPSLQLIGAPQAPLWQVFPIVQGLESSHGWPLGTAV